MIGIVVVTHGNIGCEMVAATHRIFPDAGHIIGVAVDSNDPPAIIKAQVERAMASVDRGEGLILFTDLFGGTPSNICLSFLEPERVEVLSGCNLPMLIKMVTLNQGMKLADAAAFIQQYGQRNIVIASQIISEQEKRSAEV